MILERILFPVFCLGFKAIPLVWCEAEEVETREVRADRGTDVSLPCGGLDEQASGFVQWVHEGRRTHHEVLDDGSLFLRDLNRNDSGEYVCSVGDAIMDRIYLIVRTEPEPLSNVRVHASTILALILWDVGGDGGHPIVDFTAQYRPATPKNGSLEPWRAISPNHISPNSRQIDVYHLDTNASYWFRVWATNALGPGPPVEVLATTLYSDQDRELRRIFLEGNESFDPRTWLAAVCVVMGTLLVLAVGTGAVLWRECRRDDCGDDPDLMELLPNIIMNPGFMETDPVRSRDTAASVIKSTEDPGPGKPRRV